MDRNELRARLGEARAGARRWRRHRRNRPRAEALTALVAERLPAEYDATGDHDAWPLLGAALLSRATSTLRQVFDAGRRGQSIDAATLGRSLYEHILHFTWIAADPSPARLQERRKADFVQRSRPTTTPEQSASSYTTTPHAHKCRRRSTR